MKTPSHNPGTVTRVLNAGPGTLDAESAAVYRRLYREMRTIALGQLRGQTPATLGALDVGATVLVHEAWVKLAETALWESRAHFFGSAARAMRQVLARESARHRVRRRGDITRNRKDWTEDGRALLDRAADVERALKELEAEDPTLTRIAEMKLYAGMPPAMIGELLGVSQRTVERRWQYASARLRRLLGDSG